MSITVVACARRYIICNLLDDLLLLLQFSIYMNDYQDAPSLTQVLFAAEMFRHGEKGVSGELTPSGLTESRRIGENIVGRVQ